VGLAFCVKLAWISVLVHFEGSSLFWRGEMRNWWKTLLDDLWVQFGRLITGRGHFSSVPAMRFRRIPLV